MPLTGAPRRFVAAGLLHLVAAGLFLATAPWSGAVGTRWDAFLWLLLIGFVGCFTAGFALHLFPPFARRHAGRGWPERLAFPLAEASVILGTASLALPSVPVVPPSYLFSLAALLYSAAVISLLGRFAGSLLSAELTGPAAAERPADPAVIPVFLVSWGSAAASGVVWSASGVLPGPGFGFWVAAVHLFVLGHVVLLVTGVSLRLVPRSLGTDPSLASSLLLASLGILGAILVPSAMLSGSPGDGRLVELAALPEAGLAVGLVALLAVLGVRARTPRPHLALHLAGALLFVVGGGLGVGMLARADYTLLFVHALINVLGFVGLTILVMAFGMIAPFQRVSHIWTKRMLWTLAGLWLGGLTLFVAAGTTRMPLSALVPVSGICLTAVALLWALGTFPVLYPGLNPLPFVSFERLHPRSKGGSP